MTVIAGVDVGNATTEVVLVAGGKILGAGRVPTRGRKGSPGSLRGAAALVRRLERQLGGTVGEARIAPLRAVDTAVVTVPDTAGPTGGCACWPRACPLPAGPGVCVGPPFRLGDAAPGDAARATRRHATSRWWPSSRPACATTRPPRGCGPCWRPGPGSARCWWPATRACWWRTGSPAACRSSTRSTRTRPPRAGCSRSRYARPGTPCGCWPTRSRSAPASAWTRWPMPRRVTRPH